MKTGPGITKIMKNEKFFFLEFDGSRKSQVKIDFSSIKDPICSAHY